MAVQKRTRKNYKQRARRSKGKAHRSKKYIGGAGLELDGPEGMERFKAHIKELLMININPFTQKEFIQKLNETIHLFKGYYDENAGSPFSNSTHIVKLKQTMFSRGTDGNYYEVRKILLILKELQTQTTNMFQEINPDINDKYTIIDNFKKKLLIDLLLLMWDNDSWNNAKSPKSPKLEFGFSGEKFTS